MEATPIMLELAMDSSPAVLPLAESPARRRFTRVTTVSRDGRAVARNQLVNKGSDNAYQTLAKVISAPIYELKVRQFATFTVMEG